jgi:hypothetical protein
MPCGLFDFLGPFSKSNIRRLLPVFQQKARDLSSYMNRSIDGDAKGVVESKPSGKSKNQNYILTPLKLNQHLSRQH